jgi:hypothetical protein
MENLFYEKKRKRKDGEGMVYTGEGVRVKRGTSILYSIYV